MHRSLRQVIQIGLDVRRAQQSIRRQPPWEFPMPDDEPGVERPLSLDPHGRRVTGKRILRLRCRDDRDVSDKT
jgi:hypothetical protein